VALSEWLVDKSALVRLAESEEAAEWAARIQRGLVRISTLTRLEVAFSARSATELRESMTKPPLASMPVEYLTPPIEDRAVAVQVALAERGHHRGPSIPDLLIAATAELAQLTVLHIDADYEVIADLTGQSVERLRIE
jgi:predicted nucleic acid-binding protein